MFVVDLKVVASLDRFLDRFLDRVGVISGASIYPFVWNVLLAARQAGFGGTITTMAVAEEPRPQALLNIPKDHAVAAVVPLGKPVKQLTRLTRRRPHAVARPPLALAPAGAAVPERARLSMRPAAAPPPPRRRGPTGSSGSSSGARTSPAWPATSWRSTATASGRRAARPAPTGGTSPRSSGSSGGRSGRGRRSSRPPS